jgi:hypothetical protein
MLKVKTLHEPLASGESTEKCALRVGFGLLIKPSCNDPFLRQADLRHETENFRFGSKPVDAD